MNNVLFEAAAGAGKTQFLVKSALLKCKSNKVAITTFTEENSEVIRSRIVEIRGYVPANVEIMPWYSFLFRHGVRPFQYSAGFDEFDIAGIILVNGQSTYRVSKQSRQWFFGPNEKVYSDKLAALALRCDMNSGGAMISRLNRLFSTVFIDEVQDMAIYDFDFISLLMKSKTQVIMAGDQRQHTYQTSYSNKNKSFNTSGMANYIISKHLDDICKIDRQTLSGSYRCCQEILDLANCMYPNMTQTISLARPREDKPCGVFLITEDMMDDYLEEIHPQILRQRANSKGKYVHRAINIGISKGSTYDDVCIYPTSTFKQWLLNHDYELADNTRSLFYVALTRARYSVTIVVSRSFLNKCSSLQLWGNQ